MKLTSLKLSPKECKEMYGGDTISPAKYEGPKYPYGTRIDLDKESLGALGFDSKNLPEAGCEITLQAKGFIERVEITDRAGEKEGRLSVCIQLTDLGFEETKPSKEDKKASKLDELGA